MGTALLSMEKLLQQLVLRWQNQKQDKDEVINICAGIDLSIIKNSTCVSPFDPGEYGFGAGGGFQASFGGDSDGPGDPGDFGNPGDGLGGSFSAPN